MIKEEKFITELFQSRLSRYQIALETSMKSSDFVFDCVHLLYYKCLKRNTSCVGSYIESPNWIKNKKVTINTINKNDNKFFQFAATLALNHEKNWKKSWKSIKIKPFIDKHNWRGINYLKEKDDWKKFKRNDLTK